jgi:hypothetical protein
MNPDPPKQRFQHQQSQDQTFEQNQTSEQRTDRTFDSVEELLRCDMAQTTPPPAIVARVQATLEAEPPPNRSWWRRLFGK